MKLTTLSRLLLVGACALVLGGCSLLSNSNSSTSVESDASRQPTTQAVSDDPVAEAEVIEQELMELDVEQDFQTFSEVDLTE